jgi:acetyltransferase-like isoleucine patch superfamily enzyme
VVVVKIVGAGGHGRDIAAFTGWTLTDEDPFLDMPLGDPGPYVIGVNDPQVRASMACRLEREGWTPHGRGVVIFPMVHIGSDMDIGSHVHVNVGAFMTRSKVGDFTTVGPKATIGGDVTIGARCLIGANASIRNLVSICDDVTVGCGTVVVKDITEPGVYVGNPARRL